MNWGFIQRLVCLFIPFDYALFLLFFSLFLVSTSHCAFPLEDGLVCALVDTFSIFLCLLLLLCIGWCAHSSIFSLVHTRAHNFYACNPLAPQCVFPSYTFSVMCNAYAHSAHFFLLCSLLQVQFVFLMLFPLFSNWFPTLFYSPRLILKPPWVDKKFSIPNVVIFL